MPFYLTREQDDYNQIPGRVSRMAPYGCGLNRSTQHSIL
jgi:hypothetical protein